MKKQRIIRLARSIVDEREARELRRVLLEDGYLGMGQEVRLFEDELGKFFGGKAEVVCVNSGTAALHLAIMAAVKPNEEVLVPSFTFVASFQAITAAGAKPVACDIDPLTLMLDLKDAAKRLTKRTRVIMPVHYSGAVGNLKSVYAFAKEHKLRVVEDAAHAFGTTYQGKRVGSFGDITCFSFDGIKNITCGEGGAVVTRDRKIAQFVKDARLLGVQKDTERRYAGQRSWEFEVVHQGYRYHMSNLLAAIGRVQLNKFSEFAGARQFLAKNYQKELIGIPGIELLPVDLAAVVPHIFPILVVEGRRDKLKAFLQAKGIETGIHYYPNHRLKFFSKKNTRFPTTDKIYSEILSLPLHPGLNPDEQKRVIAMIRRFFLYERTL
ncbi:MAG: DegT/DnrJ/EryC1/StrS family aminotransferase [Candidatus Omnitrophota bacterium]